MNLHTHQWGPVYKRGGLGGEVELLRTCDYCGIEQRSNGTFRSAPEPDLWDVDPTITNKGRKLTREAVVSADHGLIEKELDRLFMSIGADGMRKMNESAGWTTFPETPPWTSDDALELILREIRRDPASAGEWLTKFTNGVIEITREVEDD